MRATPCTLHSTQVCLLQPVLVRAPTSIYGDLRLEPNCEAWVISAPFSLCPHCHVFILTPRFTFRRFTTGASCL